MKVREGRARARARGLLACFSKEEKASQLSGVFMASGNEREGGREKEEEGGMNAAF